MFPSILELNLYRVGGCVAVTCADEAANVEARVLALEFQSEVHRHCVANLVVVDVLDDVGNHLKVLAGHVLLLCWGHIEHRHGWVRVNTQP